MDANQTVLLSFPATLPSLMVALIRCPSVLWLQSRRQALLEETWLVKVFAYNCGRTQNLRIDIVMATIR